MVYPGDVKVVVELDDGLTICSDLTSADPSCTVYFPRDVYNISITQTNDIGSTVNNGLFDSECYSNLQPQVNTFHSILQQLGESL